MARTRRALLLALSVGLAALGVASAVGAPTAARRRATEELTRRLGVPVEVGGADVGLSSVRLRGLSLGAEDDPLRVRVAGVHLDAGPLALLWGGPAAVRRIALEGVEASVDVSRGGGARALELARRLRRQGHGGGDSGAGREGRELVASGVTLTLFDDAGALVSVVAGALALRGDAVTFSAGRVRAGESPEDSIVLSGLAGELARGEETRLRTLAIGTATLTTASEAARAAPARRRTVDRVEAMVIALRDARRGAGVTRPNGAADAGRPAAEAGAAPGVPVAAPTPTWSSVLAPGAAIALERGTVRTDLAAGEGEIVRGLSLELRVLSPEALQVRGAGQVVEGGALEWDLTLWPGALRGEGKVKLAGLPLALLAPFLPAVPWHEPERTRLSGDVELASEGVDRLSVRGRLEAEDVGLSSPRVAPTPIRGIRAGFEGEATWTASARRLEIARGELVLGEARLGVRGALELARDHALVEATVTLPPTPCNTAVGAIPRDLLGEVAGFSWTGTLGGRVRVRVDTRALGDTVLDFSIADLCTFEAVPPLADLARFRGPFQHVVTEPDGTVFEMTSGPGSASWVPIASMSPFLLHAVLAHEDASFFAHRGFAPWSIRDALVRNLEEGRYVVGASTIVMQLAKNLFLRREKTLARKAQEVILTWWLDAALTKTEILELYLNVIEFGQGIYGIRNATRAYFGREPGELSPAEAAFIANILPAPKTYYGQWVRGAVSPGLLGRMRGLLTHMHARGRVDDAALAYGLGELEGFKLAPFVAPGTEPGTFVAAPRPIVGAAAPLPLTGHDGAWAEDLPWADDDDMLHDSDGLPEDASGVPSR